METINITLGIIASLLSITAFIISCINKDQIGKLKIKINQQSINGNNTSIIGEHNSININNDIEKLSSILIDINQHKNDFNYFKEKTILALNTIHKFMKIYGLESKYYKNRFNTDEKILRKILILNNLKINDEIDSLINKDAIELHETENKVKNLV